VAARANIKGKKTEYPTLQFHLWKMPTLLPAKMGLGHVGQLVKEETGMVRRFNPQAGIRRIEEHAIDSTRNTNSG
jgi:hypothetical protein